MTTDTAEALVCPLHHRHRVPTHDASNALLDDGIPFVLRFLLDRDGVHIVRVQRKVGVDAATLSLVQNTLHEVSRTAGATLGNDGFERFEPLTGFDGVLV